MLTCRVCGAEAQGYHSLSDHLHTHGIDPPLLEHLELSGDTSVLESLHSCPSCRLGACVSAMTDDEFAQLRAMGHFLLEAQR